MSEEDEKAVLDNLKEQAKDLGISHSPNIGIATLQEKILEHQAKEEKEAEKVKESVKAKPKAKQTKALSPAQKERKLRQQLRDENLKKILVKVVNLDPADRDLYGDFFTVSNEYIGNVSEFVPYGEYCRNGWHVSNIILKELRRKKFSQVKEVPIPGKPGQKRIVTTWVPKYSIEVLPPLTKAQLEKMAQRQQATNALEDDGAGE